MKIKHIATALSITAASMVVPASQTKAQDTTDVNGSNRAAFFQTLSHPLNPIEAPQPPADLLQVAERPFNARREFAAGAKTSVQSGNLTLVDGRAALTPRP